MAIPVFTLGIENLLLDELARLPRGTQYDLRPLDSLDPIEPDAGDFNLQIIIIDLDQKGWSALSGLGPRSRSLFSAQVLAVVSPDTLDLHLAARHFKIQEFLIRPIKAIELEMALERCTQLHQIRVENSRLRSMADRYRFELVEQLLRDPVEMISEDSPESLSPSIEKAIDQSRREKAWKKLLHEEENLDQLMENIISLVTQEWKADRASLMLFDRTEGHLQIKRSAGLDDAIIEKTRVRLGEGPAGYVAETRRPLLVLDSLDYVLANWPQRHEHPSFASIPLVCAGELVGVLNITGLENGREFTEEEMESLTALGSIAADALDRLVMYEGLKEGYLATMKALAVAIERKDPYTSGHSERVCEYSLQIARNIGLEERDFEMIEAAAMLHDIGKLAIPITMVHKPGPLNEEEIKILRQHPIIGWDILGCLRHLKEVRDTVRHHHEWWDGTGYPDGLKGDQIPLCTRIVTVADAYDALTTERAYRQASDHEAAMEEIRSKRGIQFDPEVVECFCQYWLFQPRKSPTYPKLNSLV